MSDMLDRNLRALKAVVIVMGVLILVGVAVVVVTIYRRASHMAAEKPATPAAAGAGGAAEGFGAATLPIPAGCGIVAQSVAGDRLVLQLGPGERCSRILIVDLRTGALAGRLDLVPEPQQ